MEYMYDVWVNWFDEENPNLVPYFHEWKKDDKVELMDQIPLLKVNTELYKYISYGYNKLSNDILNVILDKSFHRKNNERVKEKYSFICTDGQDVLAVILNDKGVIKKKTRLIPRSSILAIEMKDNRKNDFELSDEVDISKYNTYYGLTRLEKGVSGNILTFINQLSSKNLSLLKYLMSEWNITLHRKLLNEPFNIIKDSLINEIKITNAGELIEFNKLIEKVKVFN